jgi:hypothetical protein
MLRSAINTYTQTRFINPIIGFPDSTHFTVPGNRVAQFPNGTQFTVRYSGSNNGTYTVTGTPVFSSGNTVINVTGSIPSTATADGVIFRDTYGFSLAIENGQFVFRSCIPGTGSSITAFADGGLFSGITGITWPLNFTSISTVGNPLTPTTYGYNEIGMNGYQSSIIEFTSAPATPDVMEVVVDREMVYTAINPLSSATIA